MKFGSKRAIFGVIWGGFEGFGPCLGDSHPTHPHLGEISQKKPGFFLAAPLKQLQEQVMDGAHGVHWTQYSIGLQAQAWARHARLRPCCTAQRAREGVLNYRLFGLLERFCGVAHPYGRH